MVRVVYALKYPSSACLTNDSCCWNVYLECQNVIGVLQNDKVQHIKCVAI